MKIKSKDIARELGLSEATVSMALNHRPGVSEETRNRVLQYIERYKALESGGPEVREGELRMLAFMEDRPYWDPSEESRLYTSYMAASAAAREAGYRLDLIHVYKNRDDLPQLLKECEADGTAGIFLNATYMTAADYQCVQGLNIPYVVSDQDFEDSATDGIVLNNRMGVRAGLSHLFAHGHREIAYFRNSHSFYNMYERREAYQAFMKKKGLQDQIRIVDIGGSTQEVYDRMQQFIKVEKTLPRAIFAENYEVTIGVSNALQSAGIQIPEHISLVGFDELPGTSILNFKPTCIRALHDRKAKVAIERLIDRIEGRSGESLLIMVNTELAEGNSVRRSNHTS